MAEQVTGSCLCGSVRYKADIGARHADVCHCTMCQKWAGGVAMLVDCKKLELEPSDDLGLYRASDWGERGFCKNCGSSLFWRMQDGTFQNVSYASLDQKDGFQFVKEIFVDEKPELYSFEQPTQKLTGAEVFAMFKEGQDQ